jgi:hypothetical protein
MFAIYKQVIAHDEKREQRDIVRIGIHVTFESEAYPTHC